MKIKYSICVILLMPFLSLSSASGRKHNTLYDFGWASAKNGEERAAVLYEAQLYAVNNSVTIDYSCFNEINIEITPSFKSIPISGHEDFSGIVFNVDNNGKHAFLFELKQSPISLNVGGAIIDNLDFRTFKELRKEECILIVEDKNPWVDIRVGHSSPHVRKDVILIKKGKGRDKTIQKYDNSESLPICSFCVVSPRKKSFGNFTLNRSIGSTKMTYCLLISGQAHLFVHDIAINTPQSDLTGDTAIRIEDCFDVTFSNIKIKGTYSKIDKYGYGLYINNVSKLTLDNIQGEALWGIIGTNNINSFVVRNSNINRFDIHCYGRDVQIKDCTFDGGDRGWYCGGSSIYGTIRYDNCVFTNCTPIAYGDSYKTLVGADVIFSNCVFNVTPTTYSVFKTNLNEDTNPRNGLTQKNLPNITIKGMVINVQKGVKDIYLYNLGNNKFYNEAIGYISTIKIKDVKIKSEDVKRQIRFHLFNRSFITTNKISISVLRLDAPNVVLDLNAISEMPNSIDTRRLSVFSVSRNDDDNEVRFQDDI